MFFFFEYVAETVVSSGYRNKSQVFSCPRIRWGFQYGPFSGTVWHSWLNEMYMWVQHNIDTKFITYSWTCLLLRRLFCSIIPHKSLITLKQITGWFYQSTQALGGTSAFRKGPSGELLFRVRPTSVLVTNFKRVYEQALMVFLLNIVWFLFYFLINVSK